MSCILNVSRESVSGRLFHNYEMLEKTKCHVIARAISRLFLMVVIPLAALADLTVTGLSTLLIFPLFCFGPKQHLLHTATALLLFVSSPLVMAIYLLSGKFKPFHLVDTPFLRRPTKIPSVTGELIPVVVGVAKGTSLNQTEQEPTPIFQVADVTCSFQMAEFEKSHGFSFTPDPLTLAIASQQWGDVTRLLRADLAQVCKPMTIALPSGEKKKIGLLDFIVRMMPVQKDEKGKYNFLSKDCENIQEICVLLETRMKEIYLSDEENQLGRQKFMCALSNMAPLDSSIKSCKALAVRIAQASVWGADVDLLNSPLGETIQAFARDAHLLNWSERSGQADHLAEIYGIISVNASLEQKMKWAAEILIPSFPSPYTALGILRELVDEICATPAANVEQARTFLLALIGLFENRAARPAYSPTLAASKKIIANMKWENSSLMPHATLMMRAIAATIKDEIPRNQQAQIDFFKAILERLSLEEMAQLNIPSLSESLGVAWLGEMCEIFMRKMAESGRVVEDRILLDWFESLLSDKFKPERPYLNLYRQNILPKVEQIILKIKGRIIDVKWVHLLVLRVEAEKLRGGRQSLEIIKGYLELLSGVLSKVSVEDHETFAKQFLAQLASNSNFYFSKRKIESISTELQKLDEHFKKERDDKLMFLKKSLRQPTSKLSKTTDDLSGVMAQASIAGMAEIYSSYLEKMEAIRKEYLKQDEEVEKTIRENVYHTIIGPGYRAARGRVIDEALQSAGMAIPETLLPIIESYLGIHDSLEGIPSPSPYKPQRMIEVQALA